DPREGGEAPWEENRCHETWEETLGSTNLSTKRQRIAELARTKNEGRAALSTLHQVIDLEWMREAYRLTRKDGAPGIDGVTAADYEVNLEAKLLDLLERIKSGRYIAPPVRRVYIPKTDGVRSLTHSPDAVIHSPAEMAAAWPTTVTRSRCPRALARRTQKPFSAL